MEQIACSSFMECLYSEMGTLALVAVLFMAVGFYREFVILPERRRDDG